MSKARQFLLFLSLVLIAGCLSLSLGQDINWDLLNYHYYNGYALFHERYDVDIMAAGMQTYMNPVFDVWNYLVISLPKPSVAVFLLSLNSAVTVFFMFKIAMILFSNIPPGAKLVSATLAVLIGVTGAGYFSLLGTTTNDQNATMLVIVGFYFLLRAYTVAECAQLQNSILAAFILGICVGCKLTAAPFALGLFAVQFAMTYQQPRRFSHISLFIVAGLLGFLLVNGYWMYYLFKHFQNPFFPFFNNLFHSPFAPNISFNFSPSDFGVARTWQQLILMPYYLAVARNGYYSEPDIRDLRWLVLVVLAVIYFIIPRTKKSETELRYQNGWFVLAIFFCVSFFAWLKVFAVYRYLIPLELMSGLCIVYLAQNIFRARTLSYSLVFLLFVLFAMTTVYPNWGRMQPGKAYFQMNVPQVPAHSTIVLATMPLTYTVPFFPATTRFIGMSFVSLGTQESHTQYFNQVMTGMIKLQKNAPLYSLALLKNHNASFTARNLLRNQRIFSILRLYGVRRDERKCVTFSTNVGDTLELCPLIH